MGSNPRKEEKENLNYNMKENNISRGPCPY
jgi:hypothetical protein